MTPDQMAAAPNAVVDLPDGTVTFLLTDIEGSTELWEGEPGAMRAALALHDALLAQGISRHEGRLIKNRGEGDSAFAVFVRASDAVLAACAIQESFQAAHWPTATPLKVRMAIHTGEAELREYDYFGLAVNRCARLRELAHGGQMVLSQATQRLVHDVLPNEIAVRPLGSYLLRGSSRTEQVFQVVHPRLPSSFPPLRAQVAIMNNLPTPASSFIGREWECAEATRLLGTTRLLTLTGSGGSGKTRLALRVARGLLDGPAGSPADGVWLVELAALAPATANGTALVAQAIAGVLGVVEEAERPLSTTLLAYLRHRQALLILDNCEHLVGACAELAASLLIACPGLRLLATSQEALGITGEIVWRVPSLSMPEGTALPPLARLAQYEAVRLFLERAREQRPGLRLTEGKAAAIVSICRQLDGIPLAIELAAARVRVLSVEALATRLDDRFRLLTSGSRTAMPRQQTLRATMEWSYSLLGAPERALLRRLAVFAGGWSLEAAEAVCGEPLAPEPTADGWEREDAIPSPVNEQAGSPAGRYQKDTLQAAEVLDLLARLVAKSLVLAGEQEDQVRYGLLETVRQYAETCLDAAGETLAARDRHRAWCLDLAERAESGLTGADQGIWLAQLEREHDNLRGALAWSEHRGDTEGCLRLAVALWHFWEARGHLSEGRRWLESALVVSEDAPPALRARALNGAGALARRQSAYEQAMALHEASLALYRTLGHRQGMAASLNYLGMTAEQQGEYGRAAEIYTESLAMRQALGDRRGMAFLLNNLGNVAQAQGEHSRAAAHYEESLALVRDLGDTQVVATLLTNLGNVARDQGDFARAGVLLAESLTLFLGLRDTWGMALALFSRGLALFGQGDYYGASMLCKESLALHSDLGDKQRISQDFEALAAAAGALAQPERAARLYGAAEHLREELGAPLPAGDRASHTAVVAGIVNVLDEAAFATEWSVGRSLPLEQAVAYAMEDAEEQ